MPSAAEPPSGGPENGLWGAATERANPFVGLRPFEPEEEHLFFGREKHTEACEFPESTGWFLELSAMPHMARER